MADSRIVTATSLVGDLATATMAPDSTITSIASMAASAGGIPTLTALATSAVSSWVTVSGLDQNGQMATAVVPYLDPSSFQSPPLPMPTLMQKFGDHEYNFWSLTSNPFLRSPDDCTIGTCSLLLGYTSYFPAAGPTIFLLALFALAFLYHIPMGILYKTWGYAVGLVFGCGLEVAGYVGRYRYRMNPFLQDNFLLNVIALTIGPAFLTASIYLCLARIIMAYGSGNARFNPRVYTITFICGDILALVLQAAGGGLASTASGGSSSQQTGVNIMIAGLVVQVVSLLAFILFSLDFAVCLVLGRAERNPSFVELTRSLKWKAFLGALSFATITIFIRCCYRVAELSRGFRSDFAQNQVLFSVLESAMVGAAVIALSIGHPGFVFGKETWVAANFSVRGRKLPASSSASDSSGTRAKEGRIHNRAL